MIVFDLMYGIAFFVNSFFAVKYFWASKKLKRHSKAMIKATEAIPPTLAPVVLNLYKDVSR